MKAFSEGAMKDLEGYFTLEQVERMLNNCDNPRDFLLIYMGFRTGRRISEMLPLIKKDFDFERGLVRFRILKKKQKGFVKLKPIDQELLMKVKEYCDINKLEDDDFLFPSPYTEKHLSRQQAYNIIRGKAEESHIHYVGARHPHPHNLRHSFAIHFLRNTTNPTIAIKILQNLLEHSSLKMTSAYLQFSQEDLREDLNKVFKKKEELK